MYYQQFEGEHSTEKLDMKTLIENSIVVMDNGRTFSAHTLLGSISKLATGTGNSLAAALASLTAAVHSSTGHDLDIESTEPYELSRADATMMMRFSRIRLNDDLYLKAAGEVLAIFKDDKPVMRLPKCDCRSAVQISHIFANGYNSAKL